MQADGFQVGANATVNTTTSPSNYFWVAFARSLADMSLTNAVSPNPVTVGSIVTYTITVTNRVPDDATVVTVSNNLPSTLTFGTCASTGAGVCGGSGNNRTVTFNIFTNGVSETVTMVATVNCSTANGTIITNTATVSTISLDTVAGNNSARAITTASRPPLTITCPSDITATAPAGLCSLVVNYPAPVISPGCAVISTNCVPESGSSFPVGTNTVTCTAINSLTETSTCNFAITIVDSEAPTITCPGLVTVGTDSNLCSASGVSLGSPVTSDNCGVASVTNNAPATFPRGTNTVTWTVRDSSGNSNTCNQTVIVVDNIAPTITCPATVNANVNAGQCFASGVALGSPVTSDNCGVASTTNNAPATFPIGTNTVTWTVRDTSGNSNTCAQSVIIVDNQAPTIACPATVSTNANPGQCFASGVNLGSPVTSDNCGVASATNNAPATFPVGTNTVTWTVRDSSGNSNTCAQTVVIVDNQPPTITGPANVITNANFAQCSVTNVNLGLPVTADNCAVASVTSNAPAIFPVGTTNIVWTVTDIHGNSATSTQSVTVVDDQLPTITCPASISTNADPGQCFANGVSLGSPATADNCAVANVTNNAPATFPVGTNAVTWTVTDVHGNSNTCAQTVVIVDNQPPAISCPLNVTVATAAGQCFASAVALGSPLTTDNCAVASVTNNAPAQFPVGTEHRHLDRHRCEWQHQLLPANRDRGGRPVAFNQLPGRRER